MSEDLATELLQNNPLIETPTRFERIKERFAVTPLAVLLNRNLDTYYPAKLRLLLFIQIMTKGGRRTVPLTNAMAEEIGLTRSLKRRYLAQMEADGLVVVRRDGQRVPVVTYKGAWRILGGHSKKS